MSRPRFLDGHHRKLRYHLVAVARQRNVGVHGSLVITTPAACVDALRGMPSSARAVSIKLFDLRLLRHTFFLSSALMVSALSIVLLQLVRHLLGNRVNVVVRDVERTADIADGTAGNHRAECDDLRYAVLSVLRVTYSMTSGRRT